MKTYCTQNKGDCLTCSLVNYRLDCMNNPIKEAFGEDETEQRRGLPGSADAFILFDE